MCNNDLARGLFKNCLLRVKMTLSLYDLMTLFSLCVPYLAEIPSSSSFYAKDDGEKNQKKEQENFLLFSLLSSQFYCATEWYVHFGFHFYLCYFFLHKEGLLLRMSFCGKSRRNIQHKYMYGIIKYSVTALTILLFLCAVVGFL